MQSKLTPQIAKHLREVYFGGNWTAVNLKDKLANLNWQQSIAQVSSLHSIATLVYHLDFFVSATIEVFRGQPLNAQDEHSFALPPIQSQDDWDKLLDTTWANAETLAALIEQMPESQLWEHFVQEKNGIYYHCLHGLIEHCHYHLGQIAMIATLLDKDNHS